MFTERDRGTDWMGKPAAIVQQATEAVTIVPTKLWENLQPTREMLWYKLLAPIRARKTRYNYGRGFRPRTQTS